MNASKNSDGWIRTPGHVVDVGNDHSAHRATTTAPRPVIDSSWVRIPVPLGEKKDMLISLWTLH